MIKRQFQSKYFVNKNFKLDNLTTWKRYPVKISKHVVDLVLKKSSKNYNPKHIKYLLSLYFSEMAQYFRDSEEENLWYLDNFGSFKLTVFDRVVRLPNQKPFIKYNCKRVRFAFARIYKQTAWKKLNINNPIVLEYIKEKRRNYWLARKIWR